MAYLAQSSYKVPLIHHDLEHNRLSFLTDHLTRFVLFAPTAQRPTLSLSKGVLDHPPVSVGHILTYTLTLVVPTGNAQLKTPTVSPPSGVFSI